MLIFICLLGLIAFCYYKKRQYKQRKPGTEQTRGEVVDVTDLSNIQNDMDRSQSKVVFLGNNQEPNESGSPEVNPFPQNIDPGDIQAALEEVNIEFEEGMEEEKKEEIDENSEVDAKIEGIIVVGENQHL